MTKDDIKAALRMVAMGRPAHPAVDALVDALAEVLAPPPEAPEPAEAPKKKK